MIRPYFIGIAGGSCSGKTTLAAELAVRLGSDQTARIAIDSYYHGLASLASQDAETYDFDNPQALDHELLVNHLHDLSQGRAVGIPIYRAQFTDREETAMDWKLPNAENIYST